jgi:hypothetical protein
MATKLYTKQESHVGGKGVNVSVRVDIRERKAEKRNGTKFAVPLFILKYAIRRTA